MSAFEKVKELKSLLDSAYNYQNYQSNLFNVPIDIDKMLMNTNLASHSGLMVAAIIHKIVCEN